MVPDDIGPQEAADILLYESEAPDGFLTRLESQRVFDTEGWQLLWQAVASLISHNNGTLDTWASYDLSRVIAAVQRHSQALIGRPYEELDEFDEHILAANSFLNEVFNP
jgi:hypothetical protein